MKNFKRIASLVLALTMILCMGITAFADEETVERDTAETTEGQTAPATTVGHKFDVYQIFIGTQAEEVVALGDVQWGTAIMAEGNDKSEALLTALKTDNRFLVTTGTGETAKTANIFINASTAKDVADALADNNSNNAIAEAFANVLADIVKKTTASTVYTTIDTNAESVNLAAGYYLIVDTTEITGADQARNPALLQVTNAGEVTIEAKYSVPTSEKFIVDNTEDKKENEAAIGDVIEYKWVGTLPTNISDYDTYYYVFNDTMSKGLTLTDEEETTGIQPDVQVMIVNGDDKKDATDWFYVNAVKNMDGTTSMTVGIQDLLSLKNASSGTDSTWTGVTINENTQIIVTYSAKLNEDAVVSAEEGNENTVKLTYSNDPNDDGDPDTDGPSKPTAPTTDKPVGETPDSTVYVYTTDLIIKKVNQNKEALAGAKFKIVGESMTNEVIVQSLFTKEADGEYYLLKDGTYTKTAPLATNDYAIITDAAPESGVWYSMENVGEDAEFYTKEGNNYTPVEDASDVQGDLYVGINTDGVIATDHLYASTTDKYTTETTVTSGTDADTGKVVIEGYVDETGIIKITGLGEGTYTIKELIAPAGYNLLTEEKSVGITFKVNGDGEGCTWTYTGTDTTGGGENQVNINQITIENRAGSTLPETGGIGTTIFYICGGVLLVGAAVLLITKRRMNVGE